MLGEQAGRRRRSTPTTVLRVMVDGIERGRLNPTEQSSITFSVDEESEIIEVKTTDPTGELLLATHLLTSFRSDADEATVVSSIRLEGGQDLSLSITRRPIETHGTADFLIKFGYRETDPRRASRLWWQWLNLRFSPDPNVRGLWGGAVSARHVIAGGVVVVCLASYLGYVGLKSRETGGPAQTVAVEVNTPTPEVVTQANNSINEPNKAVAQRIKTDKSISTKKTPSTSSAAVPDQAREENEDTDAVRSGSVVPNLRLNEVKKIYIDIRGETAPDEIRSNVVESLNSSGVVTVATDADEADAALKIVFSQTGMSARLVNARGTVLWAHSYSGKTVPDLVKDLISQIRLVH
jgi:hypothetical protein